MMKCVELPKGQSLSWYLEQEILLAQDVREELLFCWSVQPTVIYGRHQQCEAEVNVDFCRARNIHIVQRKSGGGCVYADPGNLMISMISPDTHSEQVFKRFIGCLADALQQIGLPAVTTEHNDILVDGKKVSGSACYALPNATIVHGTLLYDVDLDALEQAITPSEAKLQKHAVQSVRQRVTNIRAMLPQIQNIDELEQILIDKLTK